MKNRVILLLILLSSIGLFFSCTHSSRIEDTYGYSEGLFCVKQNGKWGYLNKEGKIVIKPQFDDVEVFDKGFAMVKVDDKWGLIAKDGSYLVNPQYENIFTFIGKDYVQIEKNGKWGAIKYDGTHVLEPIYNEISYASKNFAWCKISGKYGFIVLENESLHIVESQYDGVGSYFNDGYALVNIGKKYFYVNKKGEALTEPIFNLSSRDFSEGLAAVSINAPNSDRYIDSQMGYIGTNGRFVIEPRFREATNFREGLAAIKEAKSPYAGKYGYIDKMGELVIKDIYDRAEPFSDGLAVVGVGLKTESRYVYGYINREGKYVVVPNFDQAKAFCNGLAEVMLNGKWGMINKDGNYFIEPEFDVIYYNKGTKPAYTVKQGGLWGFIRQDGSRIEPRFKEVRGGFHNHGDYAAVKENGRWLFIDIDGNYLDW